MLGRRWEVQAGIMKLMFCAMSKWKPLAILKLRETFGVGTVDLGIINLQIVIGIMKITRITWKEEETKRRAENQKHKV